MFGLDIVDDDLVEVGFVGDQGRVTGGFSHIWDKPGLATKSFFSVFFLVKKIIDLSGGQINVPSSGKYLSLQFLPATPSSLSWTL